MDEADDVRAMAPLVRSLGRGLARLRAWLGPPRGYVLTRWLILRLLGVVYLFAFLGILLQGLPLLGEHGLTPAGAYVDQLHDAGLSFRDVPTVFWFDASDAALRGWAALGLVLAAALAVGYANLPSLAALWLIYGSYERIGQLTYVTIAPITSTIRDIPTEVVLDGGWHEATLRDQPRSRDHRSEGSAR